VPTSRKTGSVIVPDEGGLTGILVCVTELKIGYARVSTVDQDLTVQREALSALGVALVKMNQLRSSPGRADRHRSRLPLELMLDGLEDSLRES
jgi:hypothetical protein